jgi:hypothetical protein
MHCPFCQTSLKADTAECPACRLTYPRTSTLVGALPRLAPVLADPLQQLAPADAVKIKKRIGEIERQLPQLVLQVMLHRFPAEHPFGMHVFWMFNAANLAGDSRRGKDNQALLVALDTARCESAILPGYGLEPFLQRESLDHLLELASPAWEAGNWSAGLLRVLDGLEQLLLSIAIPDDSPPDGEY